MNILSLEHLTHSYTERKLFDDADFYLHEGDKVGVIGINGTGKSTLLKIMAGVDKEFNGEAWAADGVKVGYLEQEPQLDPKKNVMENIMDGLGETRDLLKRFEEVSMRFGEEMTDDEMNDLINEQAELQEKTKRLAAVEALLKMDKKDDNVIDTEISDDDAPIKKREYAMER